MSNKLVSTIKRVFGRTDNDAALAIARSRNKSAFVDGRGKPYVPVDDGTLERFSPKQKIRQEVLNDIRNNMAELDKSFRSAADLSQFSANGLSNTKSILAKMEHDVTGQLKLEQESLAFRNRISELEKELSTSSLRFEEQAAIAHSAKSRFEDARNELETTRSRLLELQIVSEESAASNQNLKKNQLSLEAGIAQLDKKLKEAETNNLALGERSAAQQAEIGTLREASIGFEREANEWQRQYDNTSHRLESAQKELRELRAISTDFQREKIEFESQLQNLKSDRAAENRRFAEQILKKDNRIYLLETKTESLEANIRILEQKLELIKQDNSDLIKSNNQLEKQAATLKVKIDETRRLQEIDRSLINTTGDRISEMDLNISSTLEELNQAIAEKQAYANLAESLQQKNSELSDRLIRLATIEERHEQLIRAIREKSDTPSNGDIEKFSVDTERKTPRKRNSA